TRFSRDWSSDVCSSDLQPIEQSDGDAVQHESAAHVPGLMALAANGRLLRIRVARARHLAAEREMGRIVHAVVSPRTVLTEVGERSEERRVGKESNSRWS